jgi:drug/metabolite transporter (DMT)-like permease
MGESVPPSRWIGAVIIMIGVSLIGLGFERGAKEPEVLP